MIILVPQSILNLILRILSERQVDRLIPSRLLTDDILCKLGGNEIALFLDFLGVMILSGVILRRLLALNTLK